MSRVLLMQSILGHMALLAEKHPDKAASPVARRARLAVERSLQAAALAGRGAAKPASGSQTFPAAKTLRKAA
jgi:hypothetical protein